MPIITRRSHALERPIVARTPVQTRCPAKEEATEPERTRDPPLTSTITRAFSEPPVARTHAAELMGSRAKFTSPFAPLQLSESEAESLERLSRVILHNYVAQYEAFELARCDAGGGIDSRVWKPVKQKEDVRVFVQRKPESDSGGSFSGLRHTIARLSGNSYVVPPSELPVILVAGSVVGKLDDLMYGLMSPTIEAMRVKTSYIDDHVSDTALLLTLAGPTQDDPFQSLVIKWAMNEQSALLRPAVHNRDFVYMERTGLAFTSTGERVGFHLFHSVHFPQTHELPAFVRGNVSVCGIFRDNPARGQVEFYARSIVDPRGSAMRPLVVLAAADILIAGWKYIECANRKKLTRRLMNKRKMTLAGRAANSADKLAAPVVIDLGPCSKCKRIPSVAGKMFSSVRRRRCALCTDYVCSSCRIKKTLSHVASATAKLRRRALSFCETCYDETCEMDAFAIAQQEIHEEAARDANGDDADDYRADWGSAFSFQSDFYSLTNSE